MKRLALVALVALAACGTDPDTDSTLTIENRSSFTFIAIHLSPTTSVSWGPDLLGSEVMAPGDKLELRDIACDAYDIRVVDEDNDECILDSVDLCLDNAVWRIDDAELAACSF